MTEELHVLEPVKSLWEVWPHEAHCFTPWLADHLDRLGDALSMELKFEAMEVTIATGRSGGHHRPADPDAEPRW